MGECADLDGDGYGSECAQGPDCDDSDPAVHTGCLRCATPQTGCACEEGAAPVTCFLDKTTDSQGTVMCHEGTRFCRQGVWSSCEDIHSYPRPEGQSGNALVDPDAGPVYCNDCNRTCFVIRDNLDPVDGGLADANSQGTDWASGGGLTLGTVEGMYFGGDPDAGGPVSNPDEDAECIPGTAPDSDCDGIEDTYDPYPFDRPFATANPAIFLDLGPGETGTGVVDLVFYLDTLDIYFLLDQTKSMQSVHTRLQKALVSGTFLGADVECADSDLDGVPNDELKDQGLIGAIRCLIRDAWVGAGYFRELPFDPHGDDAEVTFEHLLDLTLDNNAAVAAVAQMSTQTDKDWPDADAMALYSLATGDGLYMGLDRPGVLPRVGCPAETWGYPCFREEAIPVVIRFTDSPAYNGPVVPDAAFEGSLEYDPANLTITSGSVPSYLSVSPDNETFGSAFDLGEVSSSYLTYAGTTAGMGADYDSSLVSCLADASASDAVFSFTLAADTDLRLSTAGSEMAPALAIYNHVPDSPTALSSDNSNVDWRAAQDVGVVSNAWVSVSGDTSGLSAAYDASFVGCSSDSASSDAVFRFTLAQDADVVLDTTGSAFDTVLSLHSSAPLLPTTASTETATTTAGPYKTWETYTSAPSP